MAEKVIIQYDAEIRGLNAKLDQVIQKQDELSGKVEQGGKKQKKAIDDTGKSTQALTGQMDKLAGVVASAFAISSVVQFGKEVVDVTRKTELLQNQLNFVAGSTDGGQRLFRQLQAAAKDLGLEFTALAKGFSGFAIASKQAGFSANQSLVIYKQLAAGIRGSGAGAQAAERAFYALEQTMSKGKVSSEELRQQLGEALPGSTAIAAKAMGVTTAEFNKMLETGQVISAEFIPKFAEAVANEFAPALSGKKDSLDSAINRANNALEQLKRNLGDSGFIKAGADVIATEVDRINAVLQSNLSGLDKAGLLIRMLTADRAAAVVVADELTNAQNVIAKQQDDTVKEAVKQGQAIAQLNAKAKADRLQQLNQQEAILKSLVDSGTATNEQKESLVRIGLIRQEIASQEAKAEQDRSVAAEKRKADEAIFLKNAVTLAQIRLAEATNPFERIAAERELLIATSRLAINNEKTTAAERKLINVNLTNDLKKNDQEAAQNRLNVFSEVLEQEDMGVDDSIMKRLQKDIEYNWKKRGLDEETYKKQLQGIEQVSKATEEQQKQQLQNGIAIFQTFASLVSDFAQTNNQIQQQEAERAISNQEALLQSGVISQKQYETNIGRIKAEAFEAQKEAAVIDAKIKTALAVLQLYTNLPLPAALIATPFAIALGARQISLIQSQPVPTFHDGEVAIGSGKGRMTSGALKSDEFMAKLQTGESVIKRDSTAAYQNELMAIQQGKLEDYIARHYIAPALKRSADVAGAAISQTANSMEMAFQQAELVNAVRGNKVVKLHKDTVKQLAGAMGASTANKVLSRRSWR